MPSRLSLKKLLASQFLATALFLAAAPPVRAQILSWTEGEGRRRACTVTAEGGFEVATIRGIECLLTNVLATATTMIGLAAFVMLIIGAFLYLTSGGNTKGTEAAKQTITYAIIGIIVALMAFFVISFIAGFTGVGGILQFNLNIQ